VFQAVPGTLLTHFLAAFNALLHKVYETHRLLDGFSHGCTNSERDKEMDMVRIYVHYAYDTLDCHQLDFITYFHQSRLGHKSHEFLTESFLGKLE